MARFHFRCIECGEVYAEDPRLFVFVEDWETKAHWEDHMAGDAIRAFTERIGEDMIESGEILQLGQVA